MVQPVPEGYRTVTPYLTVSSLDTLLQFVKDAFDAKIGEVMRDASGTPLHCEFEIGDSKIMAGQAGGPWEPRPGSLYLYVPDVDAVYQRALAAGGTTLMEIIDQFYGDRSGGVTDPVGNQWWIATHVEDVAPEELARRVAEARK